MGADNDETTARLEARQRRYGQLVAAIEEMAERVANLDPRESAREGLLRELAYLLDGPDE